MAETGQVPVQESVGAALRMLRENLAFAAAVAAAGAGIATALAVVSLYVPVLSLPVSLLTGFAEAAIFAAFIGVALTGVGALSGNWLADAGRVWAAMVVVGFFLCIVFVVLSLPGFIVLGAVLAPRYGADLQNVSGDQAATVALAERMVTENPGVFLAFGAFYALIWLALTSRLYLAAPASVDAKRILTFETWPWTKGNMLRIMGARLMLLGPAYVLVSALSYIAALSLGVNMFDAASLVTFAQTNTPMFAAFSFVTTALQIFVYRSLEAGLSSYLYRGLKPEAGGGA